MATKTTNPGDNMEQIDWKAKKTLARAMTDAQLAGAYHDCIDTALVMGDADMQGKDASYYCDEASVYRAEVDRRTALKARREERKDARAAAKAAEDDLVALAGGVRDALAEGLEDGSVMKALRAAFKAGRNAR